MPIRFHPGRSPRSNLSAAYCPNRTAATIASKASTTAMPITSPARQLDCGRRWSGKSKRSEPDIALFSQETAGQINVV